VATTAFVPRDFRSRLVRRGRRAGIPIGAPLADALTAYYELLSRWNRKINLTSITQPDEAVDRLLLEPLLAARHLPADSPALVDIGSGGGSPAIPMKLARPEVGVPARGHPPAGAGPDGGREYAVRGAAGAS
jgi:16S rRNA (guanine527-N7)-methyltransferase